MLTQTYRDMRVFDLAPNFVEPQSGQVDDFAISSLGVGMGTPWKATGKAKRKFRFPFILDGQEEIALARRFMADMHGARLAFWLPAWTNDCPVQSGYSAGATVLRVDDTQYADVHAAGDQFRHVAIITRTKCEPYGVSSVAAGTGYEDLTLDAALVTALVQAETVVCPLVCVRFADEEVTWSYQSENVVRVTLGFVECPQETPPPLPGTLAIAAGSRPVWLYRFTANGVTYRYANFGTDFEDASTNVWGAANITHDSIRSTSEILADELTVRMGIDDPAHFLRAYSDRRLMHRIQVDIYRTEFESPVVAEAAPTFSGIVRGIEFGIEGEVQVKVSSLFRLGERSTPHRIFTRRCQHQTYDGQCGLTEATYTTAGTVLAIGEAQPYYVEAAAFGTKATAEADPDWFALGKVTCNGQTRLCVGVDAGDPNRLYLNAPFTTIAVGNAISATAGDDHSIATCDGKFSNAANFGGFPYLPNTNPQFDALTAPKPKGGKK